MKGRNIIAATAVFALGWLASTQAQLGSGRRAWTYSDAQVAALRYRVDRLEAACGIGAKRTYLGFGEVTALGAITDNFATLHLSNGTTWSVAAEDRAVVRHWALR